MSADPGVMLISMLLREDVVMRRYHFTTLWKRTGGFHHLLDIFNSQSLQHEDRYAPCDIVGRGNQRRRLSPACAGPSADEVTISAQQNLVTLAGASKNTKPNSTEVLVRA